MRLSLPFGADTCVCFATLMSASRFVVRSVDVGRFLRRTFLRPGCVVPTLQVVLLGTASERHSDSRCKCSAVRRETEGIWTRSGQ